MNSVRSKYLVVGGSGLLGSEVVTCLLQNPQNEIIVFDTKSPVSNIEKINFVQGTVNSDSDLDILVEKISNTAGELKGIINTISISEKSRKKPIANMITENLFGLEQKRENYIFEFKDISSRELISTFETNVAGPHAVIIKCIDEIAKSTECSIVNIASIYGIKPPLQEIFQSTEYFNFKGPEYSLSKAALIAYTEYVAVLFAGSRVRINTISPGVIENKHSQEFIMKYLAVNGGQNMLQTTDVVETIMFLLSEKSRKINGANIIIDDAWSISR